MKKCDINSRHQRFRKELRAYHDSINRTNRYSLQKIAGKLNVFEASEDDTTKQGHEIDRKLPNTGLVVLKRGDMYAIGDLEGNPLTEFKYLFVEGCLGERNKVIRCVTDGGDIEDFDVESERIVEDAMGGMSCGCPQTPQPQSCGIGVSDASTTDGSHHEIDYSDVAEQLKIPFLCGARVVDVQRRGKKKKSHRRSTRRRIRESVDDEFEFEVNDTYVLMEHNGNFVASCDFTVAYPEDVAEEFSETIGGFDESVIRAFGIGKIMVIENVYVVEGFRRNGYAKRILSFVVDMASSRGISQFILRACSDEGISEDVLVRIYTSLGFKAVQYTDSDGVVMIRV